MVSAAKLRRPRRRWWRRGRTPRSWSEVLAQPARREDRATPTRCWRSAKGATALIVVVTSDRGLCGGFNANLSKPPSAFRAEHEGREQVDLLLVGRKGRDFFSSRRR